MTTNVWEILPQNHCKHIGKSDPVIYNMWHVKEKERWCLKQIPIKQWGKYRSIKSYVNTTYNIWQIQGTANANEHWGPSVKSFTTDHCGHRGSTLSNEPETRLFPKHETKKFWSAVTKTMVPDSFQRAQGIQANRAGFPFLPLDIALRAVCASPSFRPNLSADQHPTHPLLSGNVPVF